MVGPPALDDERLVGFDAREWWRGFGAAWSQERRGRFLLRADVDKPLSTDTSVWPSIYDLGDSRVGYLPAEPPALLAPPAWTGPVQQMWAELDALRGHLRAAGEPRVPPHRLVGVALVAGASAKPDLETWMRPLPDHSARLVEGAVAPSTPGPGWSALGFDVSDTWLLSGLSNCGYSASELAGLRSEFGPYLNRHHLFDEVEPAVRFARLRSGQVTEHAPFFVYRIWSIPEETVS
jgi:hypothetical protein